jgi:hypothetical protein
MRLRQDGINVDGADADNMFCHQEMSNKLYRWRSGFQLMIVACAAELSMIALAKWGFISHTESLCGHVE